MRSLLLDTHALYWWLDDDQRLVTAAREIILASPRVLVSAITVFELSIKLALGKLRFDLGEALRQAALDGFERLPIEDRHGLRYAGLPMRHRDPFDRMLVAQALEEDLVLMSDDADVSRYVDLGLALMTCR